MQLYNKGTSLLLRAQVFVDFNPLADFLFVNVCFCAALLHILKTWYVHQKPNICSEL